MGQLEWKKTFLLQRCIKLIKSDSKDIYNVTIGFYFKCFYFELSINPEKNYHNVHKKYEAAQLLKQHW